MLILPASAKTLVPLLFSVPIVANQSRAVENDDRDIRPGLDVVDQRRLAEEPDRGRIRRPRPGHAARALDGVDQGRLFAADERAGAQPDLDVEGEVGSEDVLAEQAVLAGVLDRLLQPLDRQRILGPDVDDAWSAPMA